MKKTLKLIGRVGYRLAIILCVSLVSLIYINGKITAFVNDKANIVKNHYDAQYREIYDKEVNANVAILGTSHITHGVNPKFLEDADAPQLKYYNFALNGACPTFYRKWYKDVFVKNDYPKPDLVIYGIDWFMFDDAWLWRRIENDSVYMRDNNIMGSAKWHDVDGLTTAVMNKYPIFSQRDKIFRAFNPNIKVDILAEGTDEGFLMDTFYKGFIAWKNPKGYDGINVGDTYANDNSQAKSDFLTLMQTFKRENIPVVLLMAPEYLQGRNAMDFDKKIKMIEDMANVMGIEVLNYNTDLVSDLNENLDYFSDWGHLNSKGSEVFTKLLKKDLVPHLENIQ